MLTQKNISTFEKIKKNVTKVFIFIVIAMFLISTTLPLINLFFF